MNRRLCTSLSLLAATIAMLGAGDASATNCVDLPTPVYVAGSSAAGPLLKTLGTSLSIANPAITIVYRAQGSCVGVDAILKGTLVTGSGATAASYWDGLGNELKCDIDAAGVPADIGLSDVFAETCDPANVLPNTINDFQGPVQVMTFVVPGDVKGSISAEGAYFVFGFGNQSGVDPWTDETKIFKRSASSGTQQMIATAIHVPAAGWKGTGTTNSDDLYTKLQACGMTSTACIGILSTDYAQQSNVQLNTSILAYQHYDQSCGYYPDSTREATDKQNVRDGHYAIWGPLHILTHVSVASGDPVSANAKKVIDSLTGVVEVPNQDFIKTQWGNHVVPQCAMRVRRTDEVGALSSHMPTRSCACKYDALAGKETCQTCQGAGDCPADSPACNFGYCEVQ